MTISPEWIVRIAQSLAGLVDLRAAVSAMSEELQTLIPHDHIDVALLTESSDELIVYETGLDTSWGKMLGRVELSPIRDLLYGHLDHMIFSDAILDDRVQFSGADTGPIRKFGLKSRLHHKIEISGSIVGALSVSSLQPEVYSGEHLAGIKTVANVVGPYFFALYTSEIAKKHAVELERQQMLRTEAEHLVEVQEKERNRIGMDLHDHVLADMSRLLRSLDDTQVSETSRLRKARSGLTSAIQDVRDIVEDARPTLLEMFGLGTAIEAHLLKSIKDTDIDGTMASPPEEVDKWSGISQVDKLLLFRIIQEAVNNAVSHAQASKIMVSVHNHEGRVAISVNDDGVGLNVASEPRLSGLKNMNARAAMMGADLNIATPNSGSGTSIQLVMRTKLEATT